MNCIGVPRVIITHSRTRETFKASIPVMKKSPGEKKKMKCMMATNEPVTKYSARLMRKQMLAAGRLNKADREYLKHMIEYGDLLDEESFHILLSLLLTAPRE